MWEHSGAIVAACALAFSIATTVLGILQRLSTSQIKIELAAAELKLSKAIADSKNEIDERVDRQGRDFGEVAIALRNKIHEVEMWSRDNFVRGDNFYKVSENFTASIGKLGDKIEERLERMEGKIDSKQTKAES